MIGYKAMNKDWTCMEFKYETGKTYEIEGDLIMCKNGFHFCENPIDVFGFYPFGDNTIIVKVEAIGEIKQEGTKFVTSKIKILEEFNKEEIVDGICNSGSSNSGHHNSGHYNSGNCNSGGFNSGGFNSGDRNRGNCNSGNHNGGSRNSGNHNGGSFNSGDYNGGSFNSGDYNGGSFNSGDYNTGNYNSGYRNSGDRNSGHYNSGDRNSGHYNSGNRNSGFFNTDEPKMRVFNKECELTYSEFLKTIDYSFDCLLEKISNNDLDNEDIKRIKELPNFDSDIFKEITGIDITKL